jgi:hypothetical protein
MAAWPAWQVAAHLRGARLRLPSRARVVSGEHPLPSNSAWAVLSEVVSSIDDALVVVRDLHDGSSDNLCESTIAALKDAATHLEDVLAALDNGIVRGR